MSDHGWCFKEAVGTSLPSSFFTYGKGPLADPSRLPALADMVADMYAPTQEEMEATLYPTATEGNSVDYTDAPAVGLFPINRRSRHRSRRSQRMGNHKRATPSRRDAAEQLPLDPSQRAISKGYSDGFLTAKIFALYGMSKLGFTGQYIADSISHLGSTIIVPGTEHYYEQWFMEGLADGEALITSSVNNSPTS